MRKLDNNFVGHKKILNQRIFVLCSEMLNKNHSVLNSKNVSFALHFGSKNSTFNEFCAIISLIFKQCEADSLLCKIEFFVIHPPFFSFQMRLIMEILWPLILFLILVAVRTRGLRKFNHQCEYFSHISFGVSTHQVLFKTFCSRVLNQEMTKRNNF